MSEAQLAVEDCERDDFMLRTARSLVKFPARVPKPIIDLIKKDTVTAILLPLDIVVAGFTKLRRLREREAPRLTVDES